MLLFPVNLAVALTGVVHFFNNVFKIILVGKNADKDVLFRFGLPAVLCAFLGAWLLLYIPNAQPFFTYQLFGKTMSVYPDKLLISILLIIFALMDLLPYFQKLSFGREKLPLGGALSGFFGGFSGNQGALRSAFLIKIGLSKEAFVGTAAVVSTMVDFTRLSVYASRFAQAGLADKLPLVMCATLSAIAGAYIGHKLLKKVTLKFLQITVALMLIVLSIALGAGIL